MENTQNPKRIHIKVNKATFLKIISYTVLIFLTIFFFFPFFIMFMRSFMTNDEVLYDLPERIFPSSLYFGAYVQVFSVKMLYFFKNTMVIVACNVIGAPLTASMCAFAFTKLNFKCRKFWFSVMLATMMLPSITLQIPMYIIYSKLGWTRTNLPLIVPAFLGGGAGSIFLIMQFMRGIPKDLNEAAIIDGANTFFIFARIVVPLTLPIITFFAVNTFIAVWNDFMGPLMYLQKERTWTIALALYNMFRGEYKGQQYWNMQMASGVMLSLPCMIIFCLFQKQLIEGVTFSGIKI